MRENVPRLYLYYPIAAADIELGSCLWGPGYNGLSSLWGIRGP